MKGKEIARAFLLAGGLGIAGGCSSSAAAPTPEIGAAYVTPAPTVTPEPTANSSVLPYNDVKLKPKESVTVTGAALIQGDVIVDGKILYDNRANTGLVVEINGGTHTITAPWGADVQEFGTNVDTIAFGNTEGNDIELMKTPGDGGCGLPKGCDVVDVVKIGN